MRILEDLKDRFSGWETLLGIVTIGICLVLWYYPEYSVRLWNCLLGFLGLRWLFVNKYRARAAEEDRVARYRRLGVHVWPILLIAILATGSPDHQKPDLRCQPCEPSEVAVRMIQRWEGWVPFMYQDAAGYWTIGYGHLMTEDEVRRYRGRTLSPEEGDLLFRRDLATHAEDVNRLVKVRLWQWQYDALTSFDFNVGARQFERSTLLRRVNAARHEDVPAELSKWIYAGQKRLRGLELRREAEARLYALAA